jgi:hypothetical protein
LIVVWAAPACKVYDPLYCDSPEGCTDPARPYCDLEGEHPASEGVARTCIPDPSGDAGPGETDGGPGGGGDAGFSCEPGTLLECSDSDTAVYCDDEGTAAVPVECGSECDADEQLCYCEPETRICSGDLLIQCSAGGKVDDIVTCPLGCEEIGARCFDVEPSNGLAGYLDMTPDAPDVILTNGAVINTDAGTITNGDGSLVDVPDFQISAPAGGVAIRVFAVNSLTLTNTTATGSRALAIVSNGDILLRGNVRVESGATTQGSCVGRPAVTVSDPKEGPFSGAFSGAGGGGFATAGASGGTAAVGAFEAEGSAGGSAIGGAALVPLRGGCSGGDVESLHEGGAGGGAIQLVSRTLISVEDSSSQAFLDAGGRGGEGQAGGSGGGSGGGVLLEAPRVVIASGTAIVANGGGGGAGCSDGEDGQLSGQAAEGGTGCTQSPTLRFGDGGSGGALSALPSPGNDQSHPESSALVFAGAGGGAVGRIRINVKRLEELSAAGIVSPEPTVGLLGTR